MGEKIIVDEEVLKKFKEELNNKIPQSLIEKMAREIHKTYM